MKKSQSKSTTKCPLKETQQVVEKLIAKWNQNVHPIAIHFMASYLVPDRLVVRTLRCDRIRPVSNPGLDR